jgi:hypothetical protein
MDEEVRESQIIVAVEKSSSDDTIHSITIHPSIYSLPGTPDFENKFNQNFGGICGSLNSDDTSKEIYALWYRDGDRRIKEELTQCPRYKCPSEKFVNFWR